MTSETTARAIRFAGPDESRGVSRHELRRYLAGELSNERQASIQAALQSDAALSAELAELKNDLESRARAFATAMPFERFVARHEARVASTEGLFGRLVRALRSYRWQLGGVALAAGAAAVLLLVVVPSPHPVPSDPSTIRLKGGAQLGLFVREGRNARLGIDGEELHPGDQIQFVVKDDLDLRSMVLLGLDGNGVVTVYDARRLPSTIPKGATVVGSEVRERPRVLEQSVILDDALGPERFFVVYGDQAPEVLTENAKRAAEILVKAGADLAAVESLAVDGAVKQSSIHIVKVGPR